MPYPQDQYKVDNLLTNVARGHRNNEFVGSALFPNVEVNKETGGYIIFDKDMFVTHDALRGVGAESKRITKSSITKGTYQAEEYSLEEPIDDREKAENDILNIEKKATTRLTNSLLLGLESKQAAIATNASNYGSDNKLTLSDDYFNESAVDFIDVIAKKIEVVKKGIAVSPNTLLMDENVWFYLKFHPMLRNYMLGSGSSDKFIGQVEDLEKILGIKITIAKSKVKNGTTLSGVWGNNIVIAYTAPPSPLGSDKEEPSFGYTFLKNGYPFVDGYREERNKSDIIRAQTMYDVKIVGADSGFLIKNPIDPAVY